MLLVNTLLSDRSVNWLHISRCNLPRKLLMSYKGKLQIFDLTVKHEMLNIFHSNESMNLFCVAVENILSAYYVTANLRDRFGIKCLLQRSKDKQLEQMFSRKRLQLKYTSKKKAFSQRSTIRIIDRKTI